MHGGAAPPILAREAWTQRQVVPRGGSDRCRRACALGQHTPEGPSPESAFPLEALYEALDMLEELAHGGTKGGHRLTVGVGDPLFGGGAESVLWQGINPLQEVPEALAKGCHVLRAHREHEVGLP